jgi:hypothetical protein
VLRSGCAASVVAMVLGDIGGSGLSTRCTGRGTWFSTDEALEGLVDAFEDIWVRWRDQADAHKPK